MYQLLNFPSPVSGFQLLSAFDPGRTNMDLRTSIFWILALSLSLCYAIPTSIIDEINASELRANKGTKTQDEQKSDASYFTKPVAVKRGSNINLKNPSEDQQLLSEWEQQQSLLQNQDISNLQSALYNQPEVSFDDKTIAEYEKGFRYGANKDKLDEALENAVLKSEIYGEPGPINQYRYYEADDRRKRRAIKKLRNKRDLNLTPEEILAIVSLHDSQRLPYPSLWHDIQQQKDFKYGQDEENWMDAPVLPHANTFNSEIGPSYDIDGQYNDHSKWDEKKKRFMVAKKRNDPTRELRYLNGPSKNDFYTLSQLLSNQREPDVPVYRRLML